MVAASALVLSAAAQDSGQAIIFSTPKSDDTQAVTPSLAPQNSDLPTLPGTLLAPMPAFPSSSSLDGEQPLAPMYSSGQQRLKQSQEERRDWTMMTPEEIFGIKSTDKLLQPPERDAFGREKKTTPMERFLERENQSRIGPTNSWRNDRANSPWNLSHDEDNASQFARRPDGTADPAQNLKRFLDSQQNRNVAGNQDGKIDDQAFDAFTTKKETEEKIEQLAAMQRFRQMLQPGSAPSTESRYFPAPKPVVNPNYTAPEFVPNPAGASFTPLSSSIGRPTGLTPLPGAFTTHPQPAVIPSWKPQPPPWVSQSGPPTAFPQQKF
ncbi:MAG TPA: hypothetical protein VNN22_16460 [Verrucomicrobiae bacterium]|nr:hypothetical protein [Verrucomicrobiae bacterium]